MLKTLSQSLLILAGCLFLISCASTGNQNLAKMDRSQVNHVLIDGKTTQKDVLLALGNPDGADFTEQGNVKWTYKHKRRVSKVINFVPYANVVFAGTNDKKKSIVIVFDQNKVVKRHTFVESAGEHRVGILV